MKAKEAKQLQAVPAPKQLSATEVQERLVQILKLQARAKKMYQLADELSLSLQPAAHLFPAFVEFKGERKKPEFVDNFANGNIAYKPAGVRRFEVKFTKAK